MLGLYPAKSFLIQNPFGNLVSRLRLRCNESVKGFVIGEPDPGIVAPERCATRGVNACLGVVRSLQTSLTPKGTVIVLPGSDTICKVILIAAHNNLSDQVVLIKKSVMCHQLTVTVSVPAVKLVILKLPDVEVEEVKPAPIVRLKVLGYLIITTPEPPAPATEFSAPPPPPEPVFSVPEVAASGA
jgi:hypothetical protein